MRQGKYFFVLFILLFVVNLYSYQDNLIGLVTPAQLNNWEAEVSIQHRFRGAFDEEPLDTFFGMNRGANVALFYRQAFIRKLELKLGYIKDNNEYTADASWCFTPPEFPVQAQTNLEYFSYQDFINPEERHKNFLFLLAVQNKPLYDRLILNTNLGYDTEEERFVSGFGAGVKILQNLTYLFEYYPVWDRDSATGNLQFLIRKYDCFSTGIKLDTYGHHFMFVLGTNEGMTLRQSTMGSYLKDLKFGFNVQRHL